jgi:hypothetical protein
MASLDNDNRKEIAMHENLFEEHVDLNEKIHRMHFYFTLDSQKLAKPLRICSGRGLWKRMPLVENVDCSSRCGLLQICSKTHIFSDGSKLPQEMSDRMESLSPQSPEHDPH